MVRAITANNLRDSLLVAEKQQSKNIHPAYVCASFFVTTHSERQDGELLSKPEVRKRLLELRAGVREKTNDDRIRSIDYAFLVHNKKRQEEGLPPLVLNDSTIETNKSVPNQSISTPDQSPAPTGPAAASPFGVGMTFCTVGDFESRDALNQHLNNLTSTSTPNRPPIQHRRWSASPTRSRKRLVSLFHPKLGQKFVKNKARSWLSQGLETIPEHLVTQVREKERIRKLAQHNAVNQSDSFTSESDEQIPTPVSQSEASTSESLDQLPTDESQSDVSMSEQE